MSLISRKLLTPDEVLKIENPNAIVMMAGKPPALTNMPDISQMYFNKLNGMGSKKENQELRIKREEAREERPIKPAMIWDIWNKGTNEEEQRVELIQDRFRRNVKEINEKILKFIGRVLLIVILLFVALIGRGVFATSLEESVLVTGTQNLVDSIISWLTRYRDNNMWRIFHILCLLPKNK